MAACTLPHMVGNDARITTNECSICLLELGDDHKALVVLPCHESHVFHEQCINLWFVHIHKCPLCRAHVLPRVADTCQCQCRARERAVSRFGLLFLFLMILLWVVYFIYYGRLRPA